MNMMLYTPSMNNNSPATFDELINQWPSLGEMATDLGVQYVNVYRWKERNSIPTKYWVPLIEAARRRKIRIGYRELAAMKAE